MVGREARREGVRCVVLSDRCGRMRGPYAYARTRGKAETPEKGFILTVAGFYPFYA